MLIIIVEVISKVFPWFELYGRMTVKFLFHVVNPLFFDDKYVLGYLQLDWALFLFDDKFYLSQRITF